MKILIGKSAVELNFATKQDAQITRALIMISADEIGIDGFDYWRNLLITKKYIRNAWAKATGGAEN